MPKQPTSYSGFYRLDKKELYNKCRHLKRTRPGFWTETLSFSETSKKSMAEALHAFYNSKPKQTPSVSSLAPPARTPPRAERGMGMEKWSPVRQHRSHFIPTPLLPPVDKLIHFVDTQSQRGHPPVRKIALVLSYLM
jgi:hypothetical protein